MLPKQEQKAKPKARPGTEEAIKEAEAAMELLDKSASFLIEQSPHWISWAEWNHLTSAYDRTKKAVDTMRARLAKEQP
jgi:hypothetical protein